MAAITVGKYTFESRDLNDFESLRTKTGMSAAQAVEWMLINKAHLLAELVRHQKFGLLNFWCLCCDVTVAEIVEESIRQENSAAFYAHIQKVIPEQLRSELITRAKEKPGLEQSARLSECAALRGITRATPPREGEVR